MAMTPQQEKHLTELADSFVKLQHGKYAAGAAEHSGNLWDQPDLLEEAKNEVIDLWDYIETEVQNRKMRPLRYAYISAPFRAPDANGVKHNIGQAEEYARMVRADYRQITPIYVHQFVARSWGIETANVHGGPVDAAIIAFNLVLLRGCDMMFVCGETETEGMKQEIKFATENQIPIIYKKQ